MDLDLDLDLDSLLVNSRRLRCLEKASDLIFRRKSQEGDSSSVMMTDYSKLIDDVGIRRDHSLLIRSTRSLGVRDYRTDANQKLL